MLDPRFLIMSFAEALAMVCFGIHLFNLTVARRKAVLTALLYGVTIYIIRNIYQIFEIPLGTHVIWGLGLFIIYNVCICKTSIIEAIATAYVSFTLIILGEWMIVVPLLNELNIEGDLFSTWIGLGVGMMSSTLLFLGVFCAYLRRRYKERHADLIDIEIEG